MRLVQYFIITTKEFANRCHVMLHATEGYVLFGTFLLFNKVTGWKWLELEVNNVQAGNTAEPWYVCDK
jgi:hypothetical protein